MRHAPGELPNGLHFLRLKQRLSRLVQRSASLTLRADVPSNLRKPEQRAVGRVYRIDHDICPKITAILSHPLAFLFITALRGGNSKCARGFACSLVFCRIEAREVCAENVVSRISLDALGTGVPTGNIAGRIQHVDGIVRDALHQ